MQKAFKYKDLSFDPISEEEVLVCACDVSASIGYKPNDIIQINPSITAAFSLRVAMLELMAINAKPFLLFNLCGNEWENTGKLFYQGIKNELELAGYPNLTINGSTEENMETCMSSIGVTLLGRAEYKNLKIRKVQSGQSCFQCGLPYSGHALIEHLQDVPTYDDVRKLRSSEIVSEIVPIGSKGALNEAHQTAEANNMVFTPLSLSKQSLDIAKSSGGPATSLLVVADRELEEELEHTFAYVTEIGKIE